MGGSRLVGPAAEGVVETEIDGCVALYEPANQTALTLNRTASDVWRLADGTLALDQLTDLLARAYGVEPDAIRDDVARTVDRLTSLGFLEPAPDP
jgi:hypothetical protein